MKARCRFEGGEGICVTDRGDGNYSWLVQWDIDDSEEAFEVILSRKATLEIAEFVIEREKSTSNDES